MTNLTLAQRVTLNAINLAPKFTKGLKTDDTFKFARGVVNGLFDKRQETGGYNFHWVMMAKATMSL